MIFLAGLRFGSYIFLKVFFLSIFLVLVLPLVLSLLVLSSTVLELSVLFTSVLILAVLVPLVLAVILVSVLGICVSLVLTHNLPHSSLVLPTSSGWIMGKSLGKFGIVSGMFSWGSFSGEGGLLRLRGEWVEELVFLLVSSRL